MTSWTPTSSLSNLKARARLLRDIRQFFYDREVLEVETPLLSNGTVTDIHLDAFVTEFAHHHTGESKALYLQTSPEYAMKRLLCAGADSIFQICKSFRNEAAGRYHNPEFTMLEWYRVGFDDRALMAEVDDLMQSVLAVKPAIKLSYQQAFKNELGLDPLAATFDQIKALVMSKSQDQWLQQEQEQDVLLQWLFSMFIEPNLGDHNTPCFVYNFPASQASLAKVSEQDPRVAHRFELYFRGVELANGFYELQDQQEQQRRFQRDNQQRMSLGLEQKPIDEYFLAGLAKGLPDCAGVALGIDRLFMLQRDLSHIEQAMSFTVDRA